MKIVSLLLSSQTAQGGIDRPARGTSYGSLQAPPSLALATKTTYEQGNHHHHHHLPNSQYLPYTVPIFHLSIYYFRFLDCI
jgi:hypothetical protein